MLYCVVPSGADRDLEAALRRAVDPESVVVLTDQRGGDRRQQPERRARGLVAVLDQPRILERRQIANLHGRRVAERRAMSLPVCAPDMPWRLRRRASVATFYTLVERPADIVEDAVTARLVIRLQSGEPLQEELFLRWFDRIYLFSRMLLKNRLAGEQVTQETMLQALTSLSGFDPSRQSFRAMVFGLAFDAVEQRIDDCPTATEGRLPNLDPVAEDVSAVDALSWMSDDDLELLVVRLPWPERPAMLLRYMAKLSDEQAAEVLGAEAGQVHELNEQAIEELSITIASYGHAPPYSRRESMRRMPRHSEVLLRRRLALLGS